MTDDMLKRLEQAKKICIDWLSNPETPPERKSVHEAVLQTLEFVENGLKPEIADSQNSFI